MKQRKKIAAIVLTGMMALSCIACANEQTATCTMDMEDAGVKYEIRFDAKGDTIQTMTQETEIDLSIYTRDEIAMLEESIVEYENIYEAYEGVTYEGGIDEDTMYEKIIIDMTKEETLEQLSDNELLPIEGETNKISLKKTLESLESQGWIVE